MVRVWHCFIEVHGVDKEGKRNYDTRVFCCFLLDAESKHLELQSCNRKTTITYNNFRHCRVLLVSEITSLETAVYIWNKVGQAFFNESSLRHPSREKIGTFLSLSSNMNFLRFSITCGLYNSKLNRQMRFSLPSIKCSAAPPTFRLLPSAR